MEELRSFMFKDADVGLDNQSELVERLVRGLFNSWPQSARFTVRPSDFRFTVEGDPLTSDEIDRFIHTMRNAWNYCTLTPVEWFSSHDSHAFVAYLIGVQNNGEPSCSATTYMVKIKDGRLLSLDVSLPQEDRSEDPGSVFSRERMKFERRGLKPTDSLTWPFT